MLKDIARHFFIVEDLDTHNKWTCNVTIIYHCIVGPGYQICCDLLHKIPSGLYKYYIKWIVLATTTTKLVLSIISYVVSFESKPFTSPTTKGNSTNASQDIHICLICWVDKKCGPRKDIL
jgi:hypothetical protein